MLIGFLTFLPGRQYWSRIRDAVFSHWVYSKFVCSGCNSNSQGVGRPFCASHLSNFLFFPPLWTAGILSPQSIYIELRLYLWKTHSLKFFFQEILLKTLKVNNIIWKKTNSLRSVCSVCLRETFSMAGSL